MLNKNLSIYNKPFFIILAFIAFFKPLSFQYYSHLLYIDRALVYLKILVAIIIAFDYIRNHNKLKCNFDFINWVLIFELWICIVTYALKGAFFRAFIDCVSMVVLSIYAISAIHINCKLFLVKTTKVLFVLIFMHVLTEVLYPMGLPADLYTNTENPLFFLSIDNGTAQWTILCITFSFMLKLIYPSKHNKRVFYASAILCIIAAFLSRSATAIVTTSIMFIMFFLPFYKINIFSKRNFWIILYIILVVLIFIQNSGLMSALFAVTGRNNFTGRSLLWLKAGLLIENSPIIGYGRQMEDYIEVWGGFYSSHNVYLEILLQGGVVALMLFFNIIMKVVNHVTYISYKNRLFFYLSIFSILTALLMEAFVHSPMSFIILALVFVVSSNKNLLCYYQ